jgi:energy-coupling factor transporter ATP-binding protein EcfA2
MGKKPLIIREINLRKVPGFPSGIMAIKGLARNINLVAGPNASGKSTTAKAIRQVLWPQDFKKQDIECRLELEGQLWDIRLDHGDYHSQRGGIDDKLPHLPAVEESKRYSLALHELVKDDDTDLAIQVGREMSGGFNLPQAEQNLGFDAKFKPRTISERKAYGEAEEKVRKKPDRCNSRTVNKSWKTCRPRRRRPYRLGHGRNYLRPPRLARRPERHSAN